MDVTQHVYDLDEGGGWFEQASLCDALQLPRLAQGTGSFRYTDNDLPVSGNGADAFGWRAEGTLEDVVNGGRVRYNEEQTALFLPNGDFKGFLVENIFLTPIGDN